LKKNRKKYYDYEKPKMDAIKIVYQRLLDVYSRSMAERMIENKGLDPDDQCWIFDFEIDEALFPHIQRLFEQDGFKCWEGDCTGENCDAIDWLMVISVEPLEHPIV